MEKKIFNSISDLKIFEENGESYFEAILTTSDYIPPEILEKIYKTIIGKPVNYRHIEPTLVPQSLLGDIVDAWLEKEDGKILLKIKGRIFGDGETQKNIINLIKKGILKGISAELWYLSDKDGNIKKAYFLGAGITPNPAVPEAQITKIFEQMFAKKNEKKEDDDKNIKILNKTNIKRKEKVEKMENKIDVKPYEERIRELEARIKELTEENENLQAIIEYLKPFQEKIEEYEKVIEELKAKLMEAEKKPILEKIREKVKDEKVLDKIKNFSKEQLEVFLETLEKTTTKKETKTSSLPSPVEEENDILKWDAERIRRNPEAFIKEYEKRNWDKLYGW